MNILIAIETLLVGGAESFVLRIANELSIKNNVILFVYYGDKKSISFIKQHKINESNIVYFNPPLPFIVTCLDKLFSKLKIDISIRNFFASIALKKISKEHKTEIIHSHLFKIDYLISKTFKNTPVKIVTTIHGDYLKFFETPASVLNYPKKINLVLKRVNKIVCISDKQLSFFKSNFNLPEDCLKKIYNGYSIKNLELAPSFKDKLNLPKDSFIFGMVSRGIKDKGWEFAIKAFEKIPDKNCYLILIGDGDYLTSLEKNYSGAENIIFPGVTDDPLSWIYYFNVGILPSIYKSESLPTAVIEYLSLGKPCIASDAGEIRTMLEADGHYAGFIIPIESDTIDINSLSDKMNLYLKDQQLYQVHSEFAFQAFKKFDMDKCISSYMSLFKG